MNLKPKIRMSRISPIVLAFILCYAVFETYAALPSMSGKNNSPSAKSEMSALPLPPVTTWFAFDAMPAGTPPEVVVVGGDMYITDIHVTVHGMWVTEKIVGGTTFQVLEIPGYATTSSPGVAALPDIRELLGLMPGAASVSMYAEALDTLTFQNFNVYPHQTPATEDEAEIFTYDSAFYSTNSFYPGISGTTSQINSWSTLDVAVISICPVSFNPVTHTIMVHRQMNFHLENQYPGGINVQIPVPVSELWQKIYNNSLVNASVIGPMLSTPPFFNANYFIITADNYFNSIKPLADWKKSKGYNVYVIKASTIGNPLTDVAVHDTIKDIWGQNGTDNNYALLIGDVGSNPYAQIPIHYYHDSLASDYYFSCTGDTNDIWADLPIGRLSVQNTAELDSMVKTILRYEQNPPLNDWVTKLLLVAHYQDSNGYKACKDSIMYFNYSQASPTFYTVYGSAGGTNNDVASEISYGRMIVNYRGHGSPNDWYHWDKDSVSFSDTNVNNLSVGNYTPIVFSIACWNNAIYRSSDCIGETWLKKKKAVSHFGATRPSPTYMNHYLDRFLFRAIYDSGFHHQGTVYNWARQDDHKVHY